MLETWNRSWQPALAPGQTTRAIEIAREVATRLRKVENVEAAVLAAKQQTAYARSLHWQPYSVSQGYAGLAILCGYLDTCFSDEGWDTIGHHFIELAADDAVQQSYLPVGMFSGLSGLAFATWYLSKDGRRYRKLLTAIEEQLSGRAVQLASRVSLQKRDFPVSQYDLISGLTGIGAYLLCRRESPESAAALDAVLSSLVELTREDAGLPRWYTPVHFLGDETMMRFNPYGNLNCGLAHGIPGPLGLLSLALLSGVEIDGMREAIERAATWLLRYRLDDQWGVNWPTVIPLGANGTIEARSSSNPVSPFDPSRTAWCYGSPGLVRALWFAGEALHKAEYQELAVSAMEAVYRRPLYARRIDSATFCHGVAGLTQITLRFARDTGLSQFTEAARTLGEQLLSLYDPDSLLGYYNLEPNGNRVDQPGLLDGVPGVVLVLLAAATDAEPTWDRLFLLS